MYTIKYEDGAYRIYNQNGELVNSYSTRRQAESYIRILTEDTE